MNGGNYAMNIRQRIIEAKQKKEVDDIANGETVQNRQPNGDQTAQGKSETVLEVQKNLAEDDEKAELLLYGDIAERSWWDDTATPKKVRG